MEPPGEEVQNLCVGPPPQHPWGSGGGGMTVNDVRGRLWRRMTVSVVKPEPQREHEPFVPSISHRVCGSRVAEEAR